jgi:hypothetical protein
MRITWGRLRRRSDRNEQVAVTGADEHVSRAMEKRRERQEVQREVRRELGREGLPDANGFPGGLGGMGW